MARLVLDEPVRKLRLIPDEPVKKPRLVLDEPFDPEGSGSVLDKIKFNIVENPNLSQFVKGSGAVEFFGPNEPDNPTPGIPTIAILDKERFEGGFGEGGRKAAILGEKLHFLPEVDDTFAGMRREFERSLTKEQIDFEEQFYQKLVDSGKEDRSFEDWFEISRLDAYIRGFVAPDKKDEWRKQGVYTAKQKKLLSKIKAYVTGPESISPEQEARRQVLPGPKFPGGTPQDTRAQITETDDQRPIDASLTGRAAKNFANRLILSDIEKARPSSGMVDSVAGMSQIMDNFQNLEDEGVIDPGMGFWQGLKAFPKMWWAATKGYYAPQSQAERSAAHDQLKKYRGAAEFDIPTPETVGEKVVDAATGLAAFVTRVAITKKILPATLNKYPNLQRAMSWELTNTEGLPGESAAMAGVMGSIGQIPAGTNLTKAGRLFLQSGALGGITAAKGGDKVDIAIASLIPFAFGALDAARGGISDAQMVRSWRQRLPFTRDIPMNTSIRYAKALRQMYTTKGQMQKVPGRSEKVNIKEAAQVRKNIIRNEKLTKQWEKQHGHAVDQFMVKANDAFRKAGGFGDQPFAEPIPQIPGTVAAEPGRPTRDLQATHRMPDGSIMQGPEHPGAVPGSTITQPTAAAGEVRLFHAQRTVGDVKEGKALGTFFTSDKIVAQRFAGTKGEVAEFDVKIEKPLTVESVNKEFPEAFTPEEFIEIFKENGIKVRDDVDGDTFSEILDDAGPPLIKAIKKAGFDALVFPDIQGEKSFTTTVVFDAKQISQPTPTAKPEAVEGEVFFHGTSKDNAQSIIERGVDPEAQEPILKKKGQGFFISRDIGKATKFGDEVLQIKLKPDAKIATPGNLSGDFLKDFEEEGKLFNVSDVISAAKEQGFDVVDLEAFHGLTKEPTSELAILNPDSVATISQPTPTPKSVAEPTITERIVEGPPPDTANRDLLAERKAINDIPLNKRTPKQIERINAIEDELVIRNADKFPDIDITPKTRKAEIKKVREQILADPVFQIQAEAAEALPDLSGSFNVDSQEIGDVRARFEGRPELVKKFDLAEKGGRRWDSAADELELGIDKLDEFMDIVELFVESKKPGAINPAALADALSDVQGTQQGTSLEIFAIKEEMLTSGFTAAETNDAIVKHIKEEGLDPKDFTDDLVPLEEITDVETKRRILKTLEKTTRKVKVRKTTDPEKIAVAKAQTRATKLKTPIFITEKEFGVFTTSVNQPTSGDFIVVAPAAKGQLTGKVERVTDGKEGLTRAEIKAVGPGEAVELIKEQAKGEPVGFKAGQKESQQRAKAEIQKIKTAQKLSEARRKTAADLVRAFIAREDQGKFLLRVSKAKTPKNLAKIMEAVTEGIAKAEKKIAVKSLQAAVKSVFRAKRLGRVKLGKLREKARQRIFDVLEGIDLTNLSSAKRSELQQAEKDLKQLGFNLEKGIDSLTDVEIDAIKVLDPRVEQLKRLRQKPISELTADEIRDIEDSIRYFVRQDELEDTMLQEGRSVEAAKVINESSAEIMPGKSVRKKVIDLTKKTHLRIGGTLREAFIVQSMHKGKLVQLATSPNAKTMANVLDGQIHKAKGVSLGKEFEALDAWEAGKKKAGWTKADTRSLEDQHEVTVNGSKKIMTTDQIMSIAKHLRSERNTEQLAKTVGLQINDINVGRMSLTEMVDAVELLNNKQIALLDLTETINEDILMPAVNETSLSIFGYELARNPQHWSLQRVRPITVRGDITKAPAIEDLGPFQPFIGGTSRLKITGFSEQWLHQIQTSSFFYGSAVPMKNARTLLNDKSFQLAMKDGGRETELRDLITLFQRMQGVASDKAAFEQLGSKLLSRSVRSILGFRVSSALAQLGSIPMAFDIIPTKYGAPVAGYKAQTGKAQSARINKFSPFLRMREVGGRSTIETGDLGARAAADMLLWGNTPLLDKPLVPLRTNDRKAIMVLDAAVQRWVFDTTNLKPGTDAFWEEVKAREEDVVRFTQPMWDIDERSVLSSSPSLALRSILSFRAAREAMLNQTVGSLDKAIKAPGWKSTKQLANTAATVTVSVAMVRGMKEALKASLLAAATFALGFLGIDRKRKKALSEAAAEKFATDTAFDLLSNIPFGNQMGTAIRIGIDGKTWREIRFDGVIGSTAQVITEGIADLSNAFRKNLVDRDMEKFRKNLTRGLLKMGDAISRVAGTPFGGPAQITTEPIFRALNQPTQQELENKAYRLGNKNLTESQIESSREFLKSYGITSEDINTLISQYRARPKTKTKISPLERDPVIGLAIRKKRAKERFERYKK